jgi:hypothetical protein
MELSRAEAEYASLPQIVILYSMLHQKGVYLCIDSYNLPDILNSVNFHGACYTRLRTWSCNKNLHEARREHTQPTAPS